ncbi:lipopolysaccharide biosynthesis protein [Chlamydiota bacterium]
MTSLKKNIIYNFCGQLLILILGFVAVKFIFKQLGADALGIIYFTLSINMLLSSVLQMGICTTTVREISGHFETEPDYIKEMIRTFSLFFWIVYILFAIAIFLLAPFLVEKWIHLRTMNTTTAIHMMRVLGISSLLAFPKSFYASLFRGLQRMEFNNFIDVFISALQQIGSIFILFFGGNLFFVVYWISGCFILSILIYLYFSTHFFSLIALIPGYFSRAVKRNLLFTIKMSAVTIFAGIHIQADKIIISKLLPIGLLGYYGFAYASVSKSGLLTGSIAQAAFPLFSTKFKKGDKKGLLNHYMMLQDLLCFAVVPIFAAIPFALMPIFSYIFTNDIARLLLLPTTLLSIGFYMNGTLTIPYVYSIAVGKPGISARLNFYALFIVLPVTILLIYFFGLIGAGLSWVFYNLFAYSYAIPRMCSECLGIPTWKWYKHILRIAILASSTYGVAWIINSFIGSYSIIPLSIAYIIASIVYLIGSYYMIGDDLRKELSSLFQKLKARIVGYK